MVHSTSIVSTGNRMDDNDDDDVDDDFSCKFAPGNKEKHVFVIIV